MRSKACQSTTGGYGHGRCGGCDCPCHAAQTVATAQEVGPGVSSYYVWSKDGQLYGGLLQDYARSEEVAAHHGQTIGRPYRVIAHADDTVALEEN